jgi:hypothetical protein
MRSYESDAERAQRAVAQSANGTTGGEIVSLDIYVPIRGPAPQTPNTIGNLGVNFGPQAPPTFSLPASPPWSPPFSALYGRAPDTVTGSLTPPHGQGPLTGAAPTAPRTAAAGPTSPVQPAQSSPPWYSSPAAYSMTPLTSLGPSTPGGSPMQRPGLNSPTPNSIFLSELQAGLTPSQIEVATAAANRPRTDSHGYLTPGASGPAAASPGDVKTTTLPERRPPGMGAAGTIQQGYPWGAHPQGGYLPSSPPQ